MNFKTTLSLLILLVIFGGVALYVNRSHKEEPAKPAGNTETSAESGKPLFDFKPADVATLTIRPAEGEAFVLVHDGSSWKFTKPVDAPALSREVDPLVAQLTSLKSLGQVDAGQAAGLTPPLYAVTITTSAGKTVQFSVGDRTALGDVMYLKLGGAAKPDVVSTAAWDSLHKPIMDLRDKALIHITADKVEEVTLERAGSPKITLQKENGKWRETAPHAFPAETEVVDRMINSVTGLQARTFVKPGAVSSAVTRLEQPQTTVALMTAVSKNASTTAPAPTVVRFGQYDNIRKESVYASITGLNELVKVDAWHLDDFKQTPLDFRDKNLLDVNPDLVSKFTLSRPATTQPTTQPVALHELTIERRKAEPAVFGPVAPAAPTTSASSSTTNPSTNPSTNPATQPAVAVTQPATRPAVPHGKYAFVSGGEGDADEGQVEDLLKSLHPLHVEKFIEPANDKGATYTLTLHMIPAKASESAGDVAITLTDLGTRVVGAYGDAHFEVAHTFLDKLTGDFKTKKPAPSTPAMPIPDPRFPGGFPPRQR